MPESKGMGGLGDISPKQVNPIETYWDTLRQGISWPRRKWTVKPDFKPCQVKVPPGPGADVAQRTIDAMQEMFECQVLPRNWQLLADFFMKLTQQTFMTKGPNWHEAPITGVPADIRNDTGVSIPGTTPVTVASLAIPDRHVGAVVGFGNGLCTFNDWNRVLWTVQIDKKPVFGYRDFRIGIGEYDKPSMLPKPWTLRGNQLFEVTARLSAAGAAAEAWARAPGFIFPVRTVTQDGSYKDFQTSV